MPPSACARPFGRRFSAALSAFLLLTLDAIAGTYHVRTPANGGSDAAGRSGSSSQPWATLGHAITQTNGVTGPHTIILGAGTFPIGAQLKIPGNYTIQGNGSTGAARTTLRSDLNVAWNAGLYQTGNYTVGFMLYIDGASNVTIRDLEMLPGANAQKGALVNRSGANLLLDRVRVEGFRFVGVYLYNLDGAVIRNSEFKNTASSSHVVGDSFLGAVTADYNRTFRLHHNTFINEIIGGVDTGYGYRGRTHRAAKIHNNTFSTPYAVRPDGTTDRRDGDFNIEIAHGDHESGVEIYNNDFDNTISVPRAGGNLDPMAPHSTFDYVTRPYSIRIHHNRFSHTYSIEGNRGYLIVDHNLFTNERGRDDQRVYTEFNSRQNGPTWIHSNVSLNTPSAFIYQETGVSNRLFVYNNTVYARSSTATQRSFIHAARVSTLTGTGWVVANNVVIGPGADGTPVTWGFLNNFNALSSPVIKNNAYHRVTFPDNAFLAQNFDVNAAAGFTGSGATPFPRYAYASGAAWGVDRGADIAALLGTAYVRPHVLPDQVNSAPDLGALEFTGYKRFDAAVATITPYSDSGAQTWLNEDATGSTAQAQDSGATLYLTGNAWKKLPLAYLVGADTYLDFKLNSTDQGEIIGIGLDEDDDYKNASRIFTLGGTGTVPPEFITTPGLAYSGSGYLGYELPVGASYTGAMKHLAFIADDDADGSGKAWFNHVRVLDRPLVSFNADSFQPYAGQDAAGGIASTATASTDGKSVTLAGNVWKRIDLPTTVTADTVLEFEISGSNLGDFVLIGFENDDTHNNEATSAGAARTKFVLSNDSTQFQLDWMIDPDGDQYTAGAPTRLMRIRVGDHFAGTFSYLVLVADDDNAANGTANVTFSNIRVYDAKP